MQNNRPLLATAALALIIAAGCGGSVSPAQQIEVPAVSEVTIDQFDGTADGNAAPAPGTTAQATVSAEGTVPVTIPGGETVTAGDEVAVVEAKLPVEVTTNDEDSDEEPMSHGERNRVYLRFDGGAPVDTGLTVGKDGDLLAAGSEVQLLALRYPSSGTRVVEVIANGPFRIGRNQQAGGRHLTVRSRLSYRFVLSKNGALGLGKRNTWPTEVLAALPSNRGTFLSKYVTMRFKNISDATQVPARLEVRKASGDKSKSSVIVNNQVTINDIGVENEDVIPSNGINSAYLSAVPNGF